MADNNKPYFVTSKNFHGDNDYVEWLKEIKSRYQAIRNRVVMQSNYGALEFNWLLGRDIVQKRAESRWGSGGVPDKPCGVGRADANPKLLLNDT